jgi:hypothetical protein
VAMFIIKLHDVLYERRKIDTDTLSTNSATADDALNYLNELSGNDGILIGKWIEGDGINVLSVWNWWDSFCPGAPPIARIFAPQGLVPPPDSPI